MAKITVSNLLLDPEKNALINEVELTNDELKNIRGGNTIIEINLPDGSTVYKVYSNTGELLGKLYDTDRDGSIDGIVVPGK
ncbi:MAG: hypothetical protein KME21_15815 [Desmonostoc vinosum HA7617-LM4]|jgi:hypothetical protein|nr:hypothetical protein [Desmonostoc vinosum HA7617-LM4]